MRFRPGPWIVAAVSGAGLSLFAGSPPAEREDAVRFHPDPAAVERSILDATRALLRDDSRGTRRALDALEEGCRRVNAEEESRLPSDVVAWDLAFHARLDMAREFAARGKIEDSFDSMIGVQRACRGCHEKAVEHGIKAPRPEEAD
jgi:hypothetical protein